MKKSTAILGLLLVSFSSCSAPMIVEEAHEIEEVLELIERERRIA
jgi:hypothetical protein